MNQNYKRLSRRVVNILCNVQITVIRECSAVSHTVHVGVNSKDEYAGLRLGLNCNRQFGQAQGQPSTDICI